MLASDHCIHMVYDQSHTQFRYHLDVTNYPVYWNINFDTAPTDALFFDYKTLSVNAFNK